LDSLPSLSMKTKLSHHLVLFIVVAAVGSLVVARYDQFLPHRWQTYTAPDHTFSIELPDKPKVETSQTNLVPDGGVITTVVVIAKPANDTEYSCIYVEGGNLDSMTPDEVLESVRGASLRKIQGTVLNQKRVTVQGHPGLEMEARGRDNSLVDARFWLVGHRLYILTAIARAQGREPKTVRRMFDSVKSNEM
jgi:hypothetical protein